MVHTWVHHCAKHANGTKDPAPHTIPSLHTFIRRAVSIKPNLKSSLVPFGLLASLGPGLLFPLLLLLSVFTGLYLSSLVGMVARLPSHYSVAVFIGMVSDSTQSPVM